MSRFHSFAVAVVVLCALSVAAQASTIGTSIGVEFGIDGSNGIGSGLSAMQVAGVVPSANWNVAVGNASSMALNQDAFGVASVSGISVNWTTSDTWNNGGTAGFSGADNILNGGYLDGGSPQSTEVNFTGLAKYSKYDIYITSTGGSTEQKSGSIGVNGTYDSSLTGSNATAGVYVQDNGSNASNYHLFANIYPVYNATNHDFEINISTDLSNSSRTPINSVELIRVPEPSSVILLVLGAATVLAAARRRCDVRAVSHRALPIAVVVLLALSVSAQASTIGTSIGVEFGIGGSQGIGSGLTAMQVAGVVPSANWNVASGNSGSMVLDQDNHGVSSVSAISVNWSSSDTWNNGGTSGFSGADNILNNGYLDGGMVANNNTYAEVNFTGLAQYSKYDIYITSTGGSTEQKSGSIGVNGTYDSSLTGSNATAGVYVQDNGSNASNYHLFANIYPVYNATNHDFEINISTDLSNSGRTPINSVELIRVPEPSSVILIVLGAATVLATAVRRRKASPQLAHSA